MHYQIGHLGSGLLGGLPLRINPLLTNQFRILSSDQGLAYPLKSGGICGVFGSIIRTLILKPAPIPGIVQFEIVRIEVFFFCIIDFIWIRIPLLTWINSYHGTPPLRLPGCSTPHIFP